MKMEEFIAGELKEQYQYERLQPSLINLQWSWDSTKINTLSRPKSLLSFNLKTWCKSDKLVLPKSMRLIILF